jgi:hypothetical protein
MKFIFTFLLIITTSAIVNAQCNYTLILGDSYGDGWNGGQMILVQNGNTIVSLNGPNPSPNFTANDTTIIVAVTPGVPVDLIWNVAGNWPSEMSVTLMDENGMSVYSKPNNSELLALTTLSTSTPTCAPCNAVPSPGNTI